MKQALNLKVSQQLSLTPQLKQSLRILQISSIELEQEIQKEIDNNPLLEKIEAEANQRSQQEQSTSIINEHIPQSISETNDPSDEVDQRDYLLPEQKLDANWQQTIEPQRLSTTSHNVDSNSYEFPQGTHKQETLIEFLSWQIQMTNLSIRDKSIANAIILSLDSDGYLESDLIEICKLFPPNLIIETDEVNAVLSMIKTLEPIGVGTKNLQERLLLMLNNLDINLGGLKNAKIIVSKHLDLLASHNYAKIRSTLAISESELAICTQLITTLNPRIANKFTSENHMHILPDVMVNKVKGRWLANVNPDNQHKLMINQTYANLLTTDINEDESEFIQQNLIQAKQFIKSLMSRYDTLLLVACSIVEHQQAFFERGDGYMQAMVLKDIAEQLGMLESTISRATAGKFLTCPNGIFELKYFFSSSINSSDGIATSSTVIRSSIKKMIHKELKSKPLSDSKIAKELETQGYIVARRTVAKYRENMRIASSNQRKTLQ